mmetsp:Transcript_2691/g.5803  ORF Transcript_2691/g.5803 Transcript_2691/m.5803 type:complete len:1193 (-) Transcript_2691:142-3720(-)
MSTATTSPSSTSDADTINLFRQGCREKWSPAPPCTLVLSTRRLALVRRTLERIQEVYPNSTLYVSGGTVEFEPSMGFDLDAETKVGTVRVFVLPSKADVGGHLLQWSSDGKRASTLRLSSLGLHWKSLSVSSSVSSSSSSNPIKTLCWKSPTPAIAWKDLEWPADIKIAGELNNISIPVNHDLFEAVVTVLPTTDVVLHLGDKLKALVNYKGNGGPHQSTHWMCLRDPTNIYTATLYKKPDFQVVADKERSKEVGGNYDDSANCFFEPTNMSTSKPKTIFQSKPTATAGISAIATGPATSKRDSSSTSSRGDESRSVSSGAVSKQVVDQAKTELNKYVEKLSQMTADDTSKCKDKLNQLFNIHIDMSILCSTMIVRTVHKFINHPELKSLASSLVRRWKELFASAFTGLIGATIVGKGITGKVSGKTFYVQKDDLLKWEVQYQDDTVEYVTFDELSITIERTTATSSFFRVDDGHDNDIDIHNQNENHVCNCDENKEEEGNDKENMNRRAVSSCVGGTNIKGVGSTSSCKELVTKDDACPKVSITLRNTLNTYTSNTTKTSGSESMMVNPKDCDLNSNHDVDMSESKMTKPKQPSSETTNPSSTTSSSAAALSSTTKRKALADRTNTPSKKRLSSSNKTSDASISTNIFETSTTTEILVEEGTAIFSTDEDPPSAASKAVFGSRSAGSSSSGSGSSIRSSPPSSSPSPPTTATPATNSKATGTGNSTAPIEAHVGIETEVMETSTRVTSTSHNQTRQYGDSSTNSSTAASAAAIPASSFAAASTLSTSTSSTTDAAAEITASTSFTSSSTTPVNATTNTTTRDDDTFFPAADSDELDGDDDDHSLSGNHLPSADHNKDDDEDDEGIVAKAGGDSSKSRPSTTTTLAASTAVATDDDVVNNDDSTNINENDKKRAAESSIASRKHPRKKRQIRAAENRAALTIGGRQVTKPDDVRPSGTTRRERRNLKKRQARAAAREAMTTGARQVTRRDVRAKGTVIAVSSGNTCLADSVTTIVSTAMVADPSILIMRSDGKSVSKSRLADFVRSELSRDVDENGWSSLGCMKGFLQAHGFEAVVQTDRSKIGVLTQQTGHYLLVCELTEKDAKVTRHAVVYLADQRLLIDSAPYVPSLKITDDDIESITNPDRAKRTNRKAADKIFKYGLFGGASNKILYWYEVFPVKSSSTSTPAPSEA